jgi:hypothetical protein
MTGATVAETVGRGLLLAALAAERIAQRAEAQAEADAATYCEVPGARYYIRAADRDALGPVQLVGIERACGRFGDVVLLDLVLPLPSGDAVVGTVALTDAWWRWEQIRPLRDALRRDEAVQVAFTTHPTRDGLRTYVMVTRVETPAQAVAA